MMCEKHKLIIRVTANDQNNLHPPHLYLPHHSYSRKQSQNPLISCINQPHSPRCSDKFI